jgi:hypothetical protein
LYPNAIEFSPVAEDEFPRENEHLPIAFALMPNAVELSPDASERLPEANE